jgi:hypothetical protein
MIQTRARCAARTRSQGLMKPCHELDGKSRSIDSHRQTSAVQLQKRWALPFAYRHRRLLLPQFSVSAGGGCRVTACALASPNGIAPETYASAGISRGRGGLPIQLSIRRRFFDPGACRDCAGQQKSCLPECNGDRIVGADMPGKGGLRGRNKWRLLKPLAR